MTRISACSPRSRFCVLSGGGKDFYRPTRIRSTMFRVVRRCLKLSRSHVYTILETFEREGFEGLEDHRRRPPGSSCQSAQSALFQRSLRPPTRVSASRSCSPPWLIGATAGRAAPGGADSGPRHGHQSPVARGAGSLEECPRRAAGPSQPAASKPRHRMAHFALRAPPHTSSVMPVTD